MTRRLVLLVPAGIALLACLDAGATAVPACGPLPASGADTAPVATT